MNDARARAAIWSNDTVLNGLDASSAGEKNVRIDYLVACERNDISTEYIRLCEISRYGHDVARTRSRFRAWVRQLCP